MGHFELLLGAVAILAGGVASVAGFGIGSLLTPVLITQVPANLAVAAVSIPHFFATFIRFWMLRRHIDRQVLWGFGVWSAVGGLSGALLQTKIAAPTLTLVFGVILIFAGLMGASGLAERLKFRHKGVGWIAGALSGFLGGLVGNQGGIRSAGLLAFNIPKEAFVATATAVGLVVDSARMPIYFWIQSEQLAQHADWIALATAGAIVGTYGGTRLLKRLDERSFKRLTSGLVFLLGIFMLAKGVQSL